MGDHHRDPGRVAFAVASGLVAAAVLAAWRPIERALMPPLVALNTVPKVAIAPLFVLWLGFGSEPKIALVWLICTFPILLGALAGLTSTLAELFYSIVATERLLAPWARAVST